MISKWFIDDIQTVFNEHRYIVVTDARGEGEFLLKYIPDDCQLLQVKDEWSELEAKYQAEATYKDKKIVFYTKKKADALTYLQEYVQTSGVLMLDDMEAYIKGKLFTAIGKNTNIGKDKLLLAAKLSEGNDMKWWQSVTEGVTEPLRIDEWLLDFLHSPATTREKMDNTVWSVFRSEVYRVIDKTPTEQPAETMAKEVANVILQSLTDNTTNGLLLDVYYSWTDSTEKSESLRRYIDSFTLADDINPLTCHPDHPFEALDRKIFKMLSDAIKLGNDGKDIITFLKQRTESKKAKAFKPIWLKSVLTLSTFEVKDLDKINTYKDLALYYQKDFAKLDTAMRKIYVAWLSDEKTLRPLQEYYTSLNNELLEKWFTMSDKYSPTQNNLVVEALTDDKRTAVIVCDGLRLEIADSIVSGITDKVNKRENIAFSVLPSVTENGMSALFGCNEPTTMAQERFNSLKSVYPDVVVMPLGSLNESVTASKLVLNYGDIDQVGEKKQLGALKDIDNYEIELRERIEMLFRLGYEKVVMTTDHGFVITGILDESDKEPRPNGNILKIEERYVLTDSSLPANNMIKREGKYFDSNYQYYAKTDKPFVTRGVYGYAHGGFTPQECIIPAYELCMEQDNIVLGIKIANKSELKDVAGNYFTVKLEAEGNESDLFNQERKVKLMLFANSTVVSTTIYVLKPGKHLEAEFELTGGINKVVIVDKDTAAQLDSCDIKKSSSRDIDDLF